MRFTSILLMLAAGLNAQSDLIPLFNGKDLSQWNTDTPGIWRVEDGMIVGESPNLKHRDYLRTRKSYSNFILKFSVRLPNGIGNSGVQFRSATVPGTHDVKGYQANIGENYWGCLWDEHRRDKCLVTAPPAALASVKKDGWNEMVLTAKGKHITIDLNGIRAVDYTETDPSVNDVSGFFGLQIHEGPAFRVEFKDLQIQEFKP